MQDDGNLPAQWAKEDTSHLEVSGVAGDPDDFSQPLILYNDRNQAIKKLNKRMFFAAPLIGIYALSVASMHLYFLAAFMILYMVAMYLWVVRRFNKNVEPLMKVDATGITVHGLITHCHIDWNNLKEVRAYTFIYKFVGLGAKNVWALQASLPMKLFLLYNSLVRFFYRLVGIKLHSINVPEQYSHFKAEDIAEQIERRRAHFLGLSSNSALLPPVQSAKLESPATKAAPLETLSAPEATLKLPDREESKLKLPEQD
ncbi:MAG: hypothetical protein U0103_22160 [Candidatus Obscuribacterales bacterium]